ncbi:hypothetical protein Misp03_77440 [Microbispora sp. NBRC 16548]|nr:hypothetical protein Misp03_77440 [Microbispora sp. NBRC 16548]
MPEPVEVMVRGYWAAGGATPYESRARRVTFAGDGAAAPPGRVTAMKNMFIARVIALAPVTGGTPAPKPALPAPPA